MAYHTLLYLLVFLPLVLILYQFVPGKFRPAVLLADGGHVYGGTFDRRNAAAL